jgi:triosephosphate isomerase
MNGTRAQARTLALGALDAARAAPTVDVAIFPPAVLLPLVADLVGAPRGPVTLGGQTCHGADDGAHTGSLAARMLAEAGCRAVLCGHSEVRRELGATDAVVRAAAEAAVAAGLRPIVCVGETAEERDAGRAREVVLGQVDAVFGSRSHRLAADVAYEPVWAIGTGRSASPDQAQEVHAWIAARLRAPAGAPPAAPAPVPGTPGGGDERSRILYGGSVAPGNIAGFLSQPDIDGVLVGGMSLLAPSFAALVEAARAAAERRRS